MMNFKNIALSCALSLTITFISQASYAAASEKQQPQATKTEPSFKLGKARKLITLKGIPFGTPDGKTRFVQLCTSENEDYCGSLPGHKFDLAEFEQDNNNTWLASNFTFGNLKLRRELGQYGSTYIGVSAFLFSKNGELDEFKMYGTKADLIELKGFLFEKYGPASCDKKHCTWIDSRGTQMQIMFDTDFDEATPLLGAGLVIIRSAKIVAIVKAINATTKTAKKENL